ncbi:MAG: hypothetical protein JWN30_1970 [Bacilli bacterium]|nr:hypothetical protein [Bacilli bacterium]
MPNSFFQRCLSVWRKIGFQTAIAAVLEALYVLCRYRPSQLSSFTRQYSNSLFLISLLLLCVSVLNSFGLFGWRRQHQLPSLFPSWPSRDAADQLSEAGAKHEEQANRTPRKSDFSMMITSLLLILLAVLLSPHSH